MRERKKSWRLRHVILSRARVPPLCESNRGIACLPQLPKTSMVLPWTTMDPTHGPTLESCGPVHRVRSDKPQRLGYKDVNRHMCPGPVKGSCLTASWESDGPDSSPCLARALGSKSSRNARSKGLGTRLDSRSACRGRRSFSWI
jgi:hypothetical protein